MKLHTNKLQETIERLNWLLSFIEVNEHDANLKQRYIYVLRAQKYLLIYLWYVKKPVLK